MSVIHGTAAERFGVLRHTMQLNLDSGVDLGLSVCVMSGDDVVADLWGGLSDEMSQTPWDRDTIAVSFSITKMMCNLVMLQLHDRGQLDLFAPVASVWPEFAAAGKENITAAHIMSHTAGLAGFDGVASEFDLQDWDATVASLAAQAPWWTPGTGAGYHAFTYGFLLGEICRRVTGEHLRVVLQREFIDPLQADFWIGLPASEDHRVSHVVPLEITATDGGTEMGRRVMSSPPLLPGSVLEEWFRRANLPSVNGMGNARSIALLQSIITNGGSARGIRFFSESTCDLVFVSQYHGFESVFGAEYSYGMGYGLTSAEFPIGPRSAAWGGSGGSICLMDQDTKLTFCYLMNKMAPRDDARGTNLLLAASLGVL
jgi:CubicO group peptidase (beta-lactamase class C family)